MSIERKISDLKALLPEGVQLVAVSKTYPASVVKEAYDAGQRVFGENRPQEMTLKYNELPKDIQWHMIGHLQTNKVKQIAPYVSLVHSADSDRLLRTIHTEALKNNRIIDVLLEIFIAREASKSGWTERELLEYLDSGEYCGLTGVRFRGVMGIATNTEDETEIRSEFSRLHDLYARLKTDYFDENFDTLSMGMSGDYRIAVECGSTMVRIGSAIFGARNYNK